MKKILACLLLLLLSLRFAQAQTAASLPSPQFGVLNVLGRAQSRAALDNVQASVYSNTQLQLLGTSGMLPGQTVVATGFYAAGDMTPATYVYSPSACATTTFGAAEVSALGGGCYTLIPGNVLDLRNFGIVEGGTDPNANNAALLQQFFNFYATLHSGFDAPVLDWRGSTVSIQATVTDNTANDHILNGPILKALSNLGGGAPITANPAGGNVCPAMFRTTGNGIHRYDDPQFDANYNAVLLYSQEANGTIQLHSPAGKHWLGSCGGPTPLPGSEIAGSNIVLMANTTGYWPGQVIHETTGDLPFNDQIMRVDANTDIVLRLPANFTGTENIDAFNDSSGLVWGQGPVGYSNAGGTINGQGNVNQFQTGDADLGVPADQDGYAFMTAYSPPGDPDANDLQDDGGLWENASAAIGWFSYGGAHFTGHQEVNNDAGIIGTSTASSIAGGVLSVGGTIGGSYQLGMSVSWTGMTGGPYYIEPGGTGTGGAGSYSLSGSPANVASTAINATSAQPTPAGVVMGDNAGALTFDDIDLGGANFQAFQASSSVIQLDIHSVKYASSQFATGMAAVVQAWTNQTGASVADMTVNEFNSNFVSGLAFIGTGGPGTWTGVLNQFTGPLNIAGSINATGALTAGSNSLISGGVVKVTGNASVVTGIDNPDGTNLGLWASTIKQIEVTNTNTTFYKPIVLPSSLVAALPACASNIVNEEGVVTDATSPTYLGTLTGGGAVETPVICNGTRWVAY